VTGPLAAGDLVLLTDTKSRRYLITLAAGKEFHSHAGPIDHDALIGQSEGVLVKAAKGLRFEAFRPTFADYVLKMPRGAQVIYPKDLGAILMLADVFPGARVFESGVGSAALSMALLRVGASITGYELRDDFAARARANVAGYLGEEALGRYDVTTRDSYEGIDLLPDGDRFDRSVLDLPEPWQVVPHLPAVLVPGGIVVAYTPSITQVMHTREALDAAGFRHAETLEVLHRTWHVDGLAVRPDHRMVAHTGFLTHARLAG
jgi:tRNA (adenine57-N1/adenine58-N1)-methyltransferase